MVDNVREQTYIKDFRVFLEGNFKGGIAKIIDNKQFTHMERRSLSLQPLLALAPDVLPDRRALVYSRLREAIDTFSEKFFQLLREFFPLLRVNYYFQIRPDKQPPPPFGIDAAISRVDTELFMRAVFTVGEGEVDITPEGLPELVMRHYNEVLRGRAELGFKFYLKVKNSS